MSISKEMRDRHTVRRYTTEPLLESTATQLNERVRRLNEEHATDIRLVRGDSSCLNLLAKLFLSKNVRNYLVMAGTDGPGIEERLGWCGADLMLFAQELGLNSWFVGGTYSPKRAARAAGVNGKIVGVIALGYGTTQGGTPQVKGCQRGEFLCGNGARLVHGRRRGGTAGPNSYEQTGVSHRRGGRQGQSQV